MNRTHMITNNPKYIMPGSEVYSKEYSNMFVYPGEDGFKNPNYFIDNRGRCFSKAWLGDSAFLLDFPYGYNVVTGKKDITFDDPNKKEPSPCSSCGGK
jgi:hypothetical protein